MHLDEQCIVVAIFLDGNDVQEVSTLLALSPKAIFRAAEESHLSTLHRLAIRLFVHKSQHQHLGCVDVLYDGGDKPVHFLKIQIHSLYIIK